MEDLRYEFLPKFGATSNSTNSAITLSSVVQFIIKAAQLIPGIIFIALFVISIVCKMIGVEFMKTTPAWISITMNVVFIIMLTIKRVRHESFILKQNPTLIFAAIFEVFWLISMINVCF